MKHFLRRPLRRSTLLILFLLVLLPETAYACLCAPSYPLVRFPRSPVVFHGQVMSINKATTPRGISTTTVAIKGLWKGSTSATTVTLNETRSTCGPAPRMHIGGEYLFYLDADQAGNVSIDGCTRIVPRHLAFLDAAYLIASGVLPGTPLAATPLNRLVTTSIAPQAHAVIILLNLLLTASLIVVARRIITRLRQSVVPLHLRF